MTTDEINRKIAEVLGWRRTFTSWFDDRDFPHYELPNWATDLNAAVGLLNQDDNAWEILLFGKDGCIVRQRDNYAIWEEGERDELASVACLAFLKSKSVAVDGTE